MRYVLVGIVIVLVTYGQLIIKHRVDVLGPIPGSWRPAFHYVVRALLDPGILSGLLAAAFGAIAWMAALSRYELSSVYPLLTLNFVLVPLLSVLLFGESMSWQKGLGTVIIVAGLLVFTRGV